MIANPSTWLAVYQGCQAKKLKKELEAEGGIEGLMQKRLDSFSESASAQRELYDESLAGYEDMATQGLPAATKQLFEEGANQSMVQGMNQASSIGEAQRFIGG